MLVLKVRIDLFFVVFGAVALETYRINAFLTKASPILLPERLHFVSAFSLHRDNGR